MSSEQRQDTQVEYVLDLANRVFRELLPIIPKEVLQFDLTMPQLKVVLLLFLNGQMRMSDIASALGVSLATATGVVDRLVDRGIILRENDASDRRVVLCRLSEKGQSLTDVLWQSARERARELLLAMTPSRLQLVNEALEALLQAGAVTKKESQRASE
ncbi:MAG: MarR family transcriptional regulator [Chloroflexota bacterium]|nr:MarR family transcriptional regulator [Chloroflexota bacterium]